MQQAMVEKSSSDPQFASTFAQIGELAALRSGMIVADAAGQYRDAGILRLYTLEQGGAHPDPVFALSIAAWDAQNNNALRAQDLMHRLLSRFPSLAAARYPLDALHVRLSRNASPSLPMH